MKFPIVSNFLCCFDLKSGCYLLGILDCLLYGVVTTVIVLQLAFDIEFIDKRHGLSFEDNTNQNNDFSSWFQHLSTTICFRCCFWSCAWSSRSCFSRAFTMCVRKRWSRSSSLNNSIVYNFRMTPWKSTRISFWSDLKRSCFFSSSALFCQSCWPSLQSTKFIVLSACFHFIGGARAKKWDLTKM